MTFPTSNHTSGKSAGGVVPSDSTGPTEVLLEGWGYYGWIITGTLLLLVTVVWGSYYAFGVFLKPLAEEFGWSRATTSGPYGLSLAVQGLVGLAVGAICDRYGPRAVTVFACLTTAVGYVFMSRMHSLWEFYLSMLVLVAIGTSTSYVVPVATIPQWFVQRRGLALGLALAGMGIGDMVFPRLMTYFIGGGGWRSAYLVMAGIVVGVALLCAALLRRSPQRAQSAPHAIREDTATETFTVLQLLKLKHFWNLFALWTLVATPLQIIRVHIVPAATDSGMSEASAAFVLTALGASVTAFRVGMGPVSDWAGNKYTYLACLALQLLALLLLMGSISPWVFYAAAVVFGMGYGGAAVTFPKIVADIFGVASMGTIIGLLGIGWNIGAALGPPMAGWIFDQTGSYHWAYLMGSLVMGVSFMLAVILLRGYRRPQLSKA